jgi:hypothetical protein
VTVAQIQIPIFYRWPFPAVEKAVDVGKFDSGSQGFGLEEQLEAGLGADFGLGWSDDRMHE